VTLALSAEEQATAAGARGEGAAMAMRIVADSARLLGAPRLIPIASAHIDGALYHGDSGTLFAERLVEGGAKVSVRSTLNVGALDLMGCSRVLLKEPQRSMARRMMDAYRTLGCEQSWTCAPYQAGHRPAQGTDDAVAIGSPHLSLAELGELDQLIAGRKLTIPIHACTGRHVIAQLGERRKALEAVGVVVVADTCVVVTPILPKLNGGVLMTNSGKFAHYAPGNTGYGVIYASLADCVESAVTGRTVLSDMPT
jgi:predicted aconitase